MSNYRFIAENSKGNGSARPLPELLGGIPFSKGILIFLVVTLVFDDHFAEDRRGKKMNRTAVEHLLVVQSLKKCKTTTLGLQDEFIADLGSSLILRLR